MDLARFDALARKAKRRGLAKTMPTMQLTIDNIDNILLNYAKSCTLSIHIHIKN